MLCFNFPVPLDTVTRQPVWPRRNRVLYNSSCCDSMFLHSGVCAFQGQWVTDYVCGRLQRELQGQAVEGSAGDLSLRIELISPISCRPLVRLALTRCLVLKVKCISLAVCIRTVHCLANLHGVWLLPGDNTTAIVCAWKGYFWIADYSTSKTLKKDIYLSLPVESTSY